MSQSHASDQRLNRYTTMGDLTANISRVLRRLLPAIAAALGLGTFALIYAGSPGGVAFGFMALGAVVAFAAWAPAARGLPLLPMIALQTLIIYGLPIATDHAIVYQYPADYVTSAGVEILVFCLALALSWRAAMQVLSPSRGAAYALVGVDREGVAGLSRLGFGLVGGASAFQVLQSLGLTGFIFDLLPGGSYPIVFAALSAASFCGFFLLAMILGAGGFTLLARFAFWGLLVTSCVISASGFLLSAVAGVLASVAIGLFWSSGRLPWVFVLSAAALISFYNSGKYSMRGRYWSSPDDETPPPSGLTALPAIYSQWTEASFDALLGSEAESAGPRGLAKKAPKQQGLLERLNNLQNILYVIDAEDAGRISPLDGATYTIIPKLLVPRILWPGKPRTHEGQVMLNTHFGRQDLQSTFKTYVAWGIVPEAYGNFGPIKGAIIVGLVLGLFFAWAENFTTYKPILSTEGFVSFVVFLALANSFEMVASVLITAIFQSIVPVVCACAPFVRYRPVTPPAPTQ